MKKQTIYWKLVRKILNMEIKPKGSIYFAGGSLCVDCVPNKKTLLVLEINGNYMVGLSADKGIQPKEITILVQKIYVESKGITEYYKSNAKYK